MVVTSSYAGTKLTGVFFLVQVRGKDRVFEGEGVGGIRTLPSCYLQHTLTIWASPDVLLEPNFLYQKND